MSQLEKAAGDADLSKPIAGIQAARNAAELAGDLDASNLLTQAIALLLQANGDASADAEEVVEEAPADDAVVAAEGVEDESKDDDQLLAGAKATTVSKAGRALNAGNMEAMKATIKSLLNMLASAGDETAAKALALYTPAPAPGSAEKGVSADDLSKAMSVALEPIFKAITDSLSEVAKDVEALKRQPRAGGPAARSVVVEKVLPGAAGPAQAEPVISKAQLEKAIGQYRQLAEVEADPIRKAYYAGKVAQLTKSL